MNTLLARLLAQTNIDWPPVAPEDGTFWLPPQASTQAPQTDLAFYFIYWVSVFFFILIVFLMTVFVFRYRRRVEGEGPRVNVTHNTPLELVWTTIPLILVVVMFYMGFRGFMDLMNPPADAMDVYVLGQKWNWNFTYPNGHQDTELHVPVDTNVRLILESQDVIHSFYVPAFRIKRDAVPGRYNKIWFKATKPGEYLALCAEYCGTQHSDMLARVVVHEPGMFEKWLADASDPFKTRSYAEVGQLVVTKRCGGCHSIDGSANVGPTFKDLFGSEVKHTDGATVLVDEEYVRKSIINPQAEIVAGYDPVMPTFKGQLKDREITAIIEYLKQLAGMTSTLSDVGRETEEAAPAADAAASQPTETEKDSE